MAWEICQPVGRMTSPELGGFTRSDDWESISLSDADNAYDSEAEALIVICELLSVVEENGYGWLATRVIGERYVETMVC